MNGEARDFLRAELHRALDAYAASGEPGEIGSIAFSWGEYGGSFELLEELYSEPTWSPGDTTFDDIPGVDIFDEDQRVATLDCVQQLFSELAASDAFLALPIRDGFQFALSMFDGEDHEALSAPIATARKTPALSLDEACGVLVAFVEEQLAEVPRSPLHGMRFSSSAGEVYLSAYTDRTFAERENPYLGSRDKQLRLATKVVTDAPEGFERLAEAIVDSACFAQWPKRHWVIFWWVFRRDEDVALVYERDANRLRPLDREAELGLLLDPNLDEYPSQEDVRARFLALGKSGGAS